MKDQIKKRGLERLELLIVKDSSRIGVVIDIHETVDDRITPNEDTSAASKRCVVNSNVGGDVQNIASQNIIGYIICLRYQCQHYSPILCNRRCLN